jgi:hypothetical protein
MGISNQAVLGKPKKKTEKLQKIAHVYLKANFISGGVGPKRERSKGMRSVGKHGVQQSNELSMALQILQISSSHIKVHIM